jgi:hypothetical protein
MTTNVWCEALGIDRPRFESAVKHREASTFAGLLLALLEHGEPLTLVEVAQRFEDAGFMTRESALRSLQRCRPASRPIYRDGDHYALDPHDDELSLWVVRLELRSPRVAPRRALRAPPAPRPDASGALTVAELDEAWTGAYLQGWTKQRTALAVLDALGRQRSPEEVNACVSQRAEPHSLEQATIFNRKNAAISTLPDGRWSIRSTPEPQRILQTAREAVRARAASRRRMTRTEPVTDEASVKAYKRARAVRAAARAKQRRVLLYGFPKRQPEAVALVDVQTRELRTLIGDELRELGALLDSYEVIGAIDVRALLRALKYERQGARMAELGPPQKTKRLNKRGRTLKITSELLIAGSCGISRPFGDAKKLAKYLKAGQHKQLRRRLEANVKSLYALYQYGRLHGCVRLRWGFLDEPIPAPWVDRSEPTIHNMETAALEASATLEIVSGSAPGWSDPWSRARRVVVCREGWQSWFLDERGTYIDPADVQLVRLVHTLH